MPDSPFLDQQERVTRSGEQRWRNADHDRWYTWDALHEEVEVFDKRGNHLGALDPVTGILIKPPKPGRCIDV